MSEAYVEMFNAPRIAELVEKFAPDTPAWIVRAMDLYADHNLPNDEYDLRGQYTENRMFLRRLEQDRQKGLLQAETLRDMEVSFARACADPEGDPMLALEEVYLRNYYLAQPKLKASAATAPPLAR